MNCPSRTDSGTLTNPHWNQNPSVLAPDVTTCQDLNGISNARELKGDAAQAGDSWSGPDKENCASRPDGDPENYFASTKGASLTESGMEAPHGLPSLVALPPKSCGATRLTSIGPPVVQKTGINALVSGYLGVVMPESWFSKLKYGGLWLLSVLFVSSLMSGARPWNPFMAGPVDVSTEAIPKQPEPPKTLKRGACASGGVKGSEYDLPLHVAALFIILFTSTAACAFPVLATNFPGLRIPASFLFFVSHFGTGVLIATAFVHLLPTAFTSLGDPCLPGFWTSDYPAMPGAIALGGIFLITVIEMVFSPGRHSCRGGLPPQGYDQSQGTQKESSNHAQAADTLSPKQEPNTPSGFQDPHLRDLGPLIGRSSSMSRTIIRMGEEPDRISQTVPTANEETADDKKEAESIHQVNKDSNSESFEVDSERNDDTISLSPEQKRQKAVMQVFLLEMGILFHSVFIGMSLSVSIGNEFVILLIAIVFHRASALPSELFFVADPWTETFEGLALGSRIASLNWPNRAFQPWVMCLAYGCTYVPDLSRCHPQLTPRSPELQLVRQSALQHTRSTAPSLKPACSWLEP